MIRGARPEPIRLEPKFCTKPMESPRLRGLDSAAAKDCCTGFIGPSNTPISIRAAIRTPKVAARPEIREQTENTAVALTRNSFRWPSRSITVPPTKPESPQARLKPEAIRPMWALVSPRSFCTKGPR